MQLDLKGLTFNFVIINFLEAVAEVIFYLECDDFPNTWQVQLITGWDETEKTRLLSGQTVTWGY